MKKRTASRLMAGVLSIALLCSMLPSALGVEEESQNGTEDGAQLGLEDLQPAQPGEAGEVPADGTDGEAGAGGGTTDEPDEPDGGEVTQPVDFTVDFPSQEISLKVGDSVSLLATVTGLTQEQIDQAEVTWSESNNDGRVTVTPDAVNPLQAQIKAEKSAETTQTKPVTVTVTVKYSTVSKTANCNITVSPSDPASIQLSSQAEELIPGQSVRLIAKVYPETASQDVVWSSENTAIATVAADGTVTAGTQAGQTRIVATSGTMKAYCTITVQGIVLSTHSLTLRAGNSYTMGYTIYGDSLGKTVSWSSSDTSIVRVDGGYLYAVYAGGPVTITASVGGSTYSDSCTVQVERNTADTIFASVDAGMPLCFSQIQTRLDTQCRNVLGSSLSYISGLTVGTRQGTLYYRYQSDNDTGAGIGTGERYYASASLGQMSLSDVYFVPKADFSGTAVISYTGYANGTSFFQGTIEVTVAEQSEISYSVTGTKPVQFNVEDFDRMCRSRTGRDLDCVVFTQPDSQRGTLYYNYISEQNYGSKVDEGKEYRRNGSPSLSDVYFVPESNFSGEVVISYTAYDVNGDSFRGRVRIRVAEAVAGGDLNYSIAQGGRLTMDEDDFNDLSKAVTGYALDYVRFSLPSSSQGTLYYNYTSSGNYDSLVTENRSYYRSSSPYLRRVSFVAEKDYSGTVTLDFTAWDVKGNYFSGMVEIAVGKTASGDIRYSTYQGGKVTFNDNDFNTLCQELTDSTLKYVKFQLPSSSEGTLYYNYKDGDYDSKVTESKSYYRYSSPYIDKVSFVPKSGFVGTVSIAFTGWNSKNERFEGTVEIGVDSGSNQISYHVGYGEVVDFDDRDFDELSEYLTGDPLRYVRFTLPSSSKGVLYYEYDRGDYSSKVSSSRSYYRSSRPYLDRVSFVPDDTFAGTAEISFVGYSTAGERFEGTIEIVVDAPAGPDLIYYSTAYAPVTFKAQDFVKACEARGLGSLVSVQFSPPSVAAGRLYYRYENLGSKGTEVRYTSKYYPGTTPNLSEVTFLPKAGYQGLTTIYYTAVDSRENTYQGQIQISVQPSSVSRYFYDMGAYAWAVPSVDLLYEAGMITGTGNGTYGPGQRISRGDYMLMLYRVFDFSPRTASGFNDVPQNSYYAQAVLTARALGIADGYPDGGFHPQDSLSRQDAMVFLKRAMQAAGWSMSPGDTSLLSGFKDGGEVAPYARDAMATMISYGIITGASDGALAPNAQVTRGEMAVILARMLTM